jgi:hypothetical protein
MQIIQRKKYSSDYFNKLNDIKYVAERLNGKKLHITYLYVLNTGFSRIRLLDMRQIYCSALYIFYIRQILNNSLWPLCSLNM